jgi:rhodanese-related sulfurtransferase
MPSGKMEESAAMSERVIITPAELKERIDSGERPVVIDVREEEEVAAGMIPGARNIPLAELPDRHDEIPASGEVILVCRSGNRSSRAYDYLQLQGFTNIINMRGGMMEWDGLA